MPDSASKPLTAAKVRAVLRKAGYAAHEGVSGFRVFKEQAGGFSVVYWPRGSTPACALYDYRVALQAAGIDAVQDTVSRCVLCRGYVPSQEGGATT